MATAINPPAAIFMIALERIAKTSSFYVAPGVYRTIHCAGSLRVVALCGFDNASLHSPGNIMTQNLLSM
jgi:hypothetical protein